MDTFSKTEMNNALLGMYVGTWGPKALRKCIIDQLFTYQMYRHEEEIRKHLDADMVLLVFPPGQNLLSLDVLDHLIVPEIGLLAFGLSTDKQDSSELRKSIQDILEGRTFNEYLKSKENKFRKSKLLSKTQLTKIYPDDIDANINDLDITVLCFILFQGMGYRPISDFDKLPSDSVITEADDMLRIKICRNILVHQPFAEVSDEDFETYWECLTGAFERLLKSPRVRQESERLKALRLSEEKIEQFKVMLQGWRTDEQDDQRKHLDQIKDIVSKSELHTECIIKATGTQIVENQNKTHREVVKLFKKRQKAHNNELKQSFPLRVHGYDKFKEMCNIMHEKRIKFSIPTASSSTDTPANSDSSSSPRISDPGIEQFQKENEDAVHKMCTNLRRRGDSCYATIDTTSSSNIATNASKPFHGGSLTDVGSETKPKDADDDNESAYEYSTLQNNTSEDIERQTALRSNLCLLPQYENDAPDETGSHWSLCCIGLDEPQHLELSNYNKATHLLEIPYAGMSFYRDTSSQSDRYYMCEEESLSMRNANKTHEEVYSDLDQGTFRAQITHESKSRQRRCYAFNEKDSEELDRIMQEDFPFTMATTTDHDRCLEQHHSGMDQGTFRAQITHESKSRQRRCYAFNEKDSEELDKIMQEDFPFTMATTTDHDRCLEQHHSGMVPDTGIPVYMGGNSESSGYYSSALAASSSLYGTTGRGTSELVPDTEIPVYMGGNSESSGYYSSALAASSSLYGTTGRGTSELVPDTGIPVYMGGNSESSGYYSSAFAASSFLFVTTGRGTSELVPSKGGMYSEDSTGYNTDLLTLNSSLDGNTSSDTLLFHPLRLPMLQSSPIRYKGRKPLTAKKGEKAPKDSVNANATDDGYASNGYFSSLDRHHPACQEQYENNVLDNAANAFEQREDCFNNHTETDNNELRHDKHAPEVKRLIENSKSKRKKGFSLRNCFRNCIFCGGQNVENEQENPINVNESLRRRESERCLLSSRDPIDTPEPIMRMQLWETHRSDRGSQTDQTNDDGEHELKEIFV